MNEDKFDLGREGLVYTYAQIVFHLTFRYLKLTDKESLKKPIDLGYPRSLTWSFEVDYEIQGLQVQSIINTAFFLEAYINDYCSRHLGRSTANQLDKLSTPSKYAIATKLIWDEGIDTGSKAFQQLQNLFSLRNKLAHPKSTSKGNLLDIPSILANSDTLTPSDNIEIIMSILKVFYEKKTDSVTDVLLKQIVAWLNVAESDLDFYPIPSNAGL